MRARGGDLLGARIRTDDGFEVLAEIDGRLTAAAGAIPGPLARRARAREEIEQGARIVRAKLRVLSGEARKMILEVQREVPCAR